MASVYNNRLVEQLKAIYFDLYGHLGGTEATFGSMSLKQE